ncbi:small, acid-soluble spore protein, alpha/beta type [Priestia abyssalis]|uniref:small, acid-soluble spore protein, alpha/beta type n=1 Tax=Priestia abyssalis TaxID=1221450 RepID=UPI001472CD66
MVNRNISRSNNSNEVLVSSAEAALQQMKYEIAREFGVQLGPDTTSRANGSVGGEITKRLVQMAEQKLGGTGRLH